MVSILARIQSFFELNVMAIQVILTKLSQMPIWEKGLIGFLFLLTCFLIGFCVAKFFKALDRWDEARVKKAGEIKATAIPVEQLLGETN